MPCKRLPAIASLGSLVVPAAAFMAWGAAAAIGSWKPDARIFTADLRQYFSASDQATLPMPAIHRKQFDNPFMCGLQFRVGRRS